MTNKTAIHNYSVGTQRGQGRWSQQKLTNTEAKPTQ
jgi:hypothetical protein